MLCSLILCPSQQRWKPYLNPTAAGGRAAGVVLQGRGSNPSSSSNGASQQPEIIHARRGVISNASVWDTLKLLPEHAAPQEWTQECSRTPQTGSFMHLHLGEMDAAAGPCFWMDHFGAATACLHPAAYAPWALPGMLLCRALQC